VFSLVLLYDYSTLGLLVGFLNVDINHFPHTYPNPKHNKTIYRVASANAVRILHTVIGICLARIFGFVLSLAYFVSIPLSVFDAVLDSKAVFGPFDICIQPWYNMTECH